MFPPKPWPPVNDKSYAFLVAAGATEFHHLDPGRQYVLRMWMVSEDDWTALGSEVVTVETAVPLADSPYHVVSSLMPVPGLEAGVDGNKELTFYASANVLVVTVPPGSDSSTALRVLITPVYTSPE